MVVHTIVLAIRGKVWFLVLLTLIELVPVRPTVLDRVSIERMKAFDVVCIIILCETMKCFTVILFSILFNKENVL